MATYQIPENREAISWFDLPFNRTMTLHCWNNTGGSRLQLSLVPPHPSVDLRVLPSVARPSGSVSFTLTGRSSGASTKVTACVQGTTARYDLRVSVKGNPKKQPGYTVDLLADVALTGNALRVYRYSRVMKDTQDDSHILCQNRTPGHYNCGDIAAAYGEITDRNSYLNAAKYKARRIFPKPVYLRHQLYYLPPKSRKMADLRFHASRVTRGIQQIERLLDDGTPVRVWLIHDDGFEPVIRPDWRTHYLTIIGYSGTRFLYLDPWWQGSELEYDGGMYPKKRIEFMGELEFDLSRPEMGIASPSSASGAHKYKVIAGP